VINVQAIGVPPDAQQEAAGERPAGTRRSFVLCSKHLEQRREWINMPEGEERHVEHHRLFHAVTACPDCQELSWSSQAPPPQQPEQQPQGQQPDTYSWWRDVMGQP